MNWCLNFLLFYENSYMKFLDKAKALANEAADVGKRVANVVTEHVDDMAAKDDRVGKFVTQTKEVTKSGIEAAQKKSDEFAQKESGQAAGRAVRKLGQVVNSLPVLSAAADAIKSKNCVDLLLQKFQNDPSNAYNNLWLAESLIKTSQDMKKFRYVKGAIDPSSFLIAGVMKKTAEMGKDSIPTHEKLLRQAWALAVKNMKQTPRNSAALDVLARVYLAKGDQQRAIATAKAAVLADSRDPIARVTLGRALLANRQFVEAREAGDSAVRAGSTVGYLISAEASQLDSRDGNKVQVAERIMAYEKLVAKITVADRILYNGAYREPEEVAQATKVSQTEKAGQTWATAKRWAGIIKDA